jgi:uncharacterized protein involved in exopolysaccharide biosynthesis
MKRTIVEHEAKLKGLRAQSYGESLSQADLIEYETLKEQYKALLIKRLDSRMSAELERRQIGEQFKILDPARLPESPIGPDRLRVTVLGTLVGLAIGVVLAALRRSPTARPPALAEA